MLQPNATGPRFKVNQMVRLRTQPTSTGVVLKVQQLEDGRYVYQVFFGSENRLYVAERDLLPVIEDVTERWDARYCGRLDDLRREILLAKLSTYGDTLYSLHASRVEFHVYQFKPVLKFLRNPDQRLLLADEVGLGKTIEAGIIMTELQARVDVRRVLVVCPAALQSKWRDDMRSRFEEKFDILNAERLRTFLDEYSKFGPGAPVRGIVSLELIRRQEFVERLAEYDAHFDLVIIDEAHHCRNPETQANEVATVLADRADALLLLTATPLQMGIQDLFHLLHILSPSEFDDPYTFQDAIEPNRYINAASRYLMAGQQNAARQMLKKVEQTREGKRFIRNPYYREVLEQLRHGCDSREQALRAQRMLLELNTLAHIFTRSRKREVLLDAPIRRAHTVRFRLCAQEQAFYDAIISYVRRVYRMSSWSVGFVLVTRERQAASSLPAFREHYLHALTKDYTDAEELSALHGVIADEETLGAMQQTLPALLERLLEPARQQLYRAAANMGGIDTKFDTFLRILNDVFAEEPGAKILVFSFFKKTLDYLEERLRRAGIKATAIHGDLPVVDRLSIVERFRDTQEIQVLLSSEVGSEGLDFQFCHVLINYDLPWNPMKVEQRIGRIDRFGQQSRQLSIYSFVAEGTVEERIYARLYERIRIFEESIGDLEAVLGEVMKDLSQKVYSRDLSPDEERRLADQAADTILRKKQELEEFEQYRLEFMGQDGILEQEVRELVEMGRHISGEEVRALVETYLEHGLKRTRLEKNDDDNTWVLVPDSELVQAITRAMPRSDPSYSAFQRRIQTHDLIPLTFSDQLAYERKLVDFITVRHPLARAAAAYWRDTMPEDVRILSVHVRKTAELQGRFYFFLFSLSTAGLRKEEQLMPVVVEPKRMGVDLTLSTRFLRIIQESEETRPGVKKDLVPDVYEKALEIAVSFIEGKRDERESEMKRLNDALIDARLRALERTYNFKSRRVRGYLQTAHEPRIVRMRKAQLKNLTAKYEADRAELEKRRSISVTYSLRLAGVIHFE